jgi:hypothetical protein
MNQKVLLHLQRSVSMGLKRTVTTNTFAANPTKRCDNEASASTDMSEVTESPSSKTVCVFETRSRMRRPWYECGEASNMRHPDRSELVDCHRRFDCAGESHLTPCR